jgi:hypothetical protein
LQELYIFNSGLKELPNEIIYLNDLQILNIYNPPPDINGKYKCPRCSNKNTISQNIQPRHVNGGIIVIVRCLDLACNLNWSWSF